MRNLTLFSAVLLASAKDTPKGGGASPGPDAGKTPAPGTQAATGAPVGPDGPVNEVDNEGVEMLRKISPATVIGQFKKPRKPLLVDGKPVMGDDNKPRTEAYGEEEVWPDTPLYVVIGVTHGLKTGSGDNGPWVSFLGAFEAQRFSDGQRFQGGQCFVPKAVEDIMVATLNATQKAQGAAGGIAAIEFGIEVGIKHATTTVGYEYTVKNLVKTQGTDPLALLRNKVRGTLGNRLPSTVLPSLPPAQGAPALPAK